MAKTIVVVGFGPGISSGVADKFAAEGFAVALVGRTQERLEAGVAALKADGREAAAFVADAGDPAAIRVAIKAAHDQLGPVGAILWNAFDPNLPGDLLTAEPAALARTFDIAINGLVAAVQEALPDLKAAGDGAVLVTNGAFADLTQMMDDIAIGLQAMSLALANAAKHKLVGLLSRRLKDDGVYVGEVMIAGGIKGTPTAGGGGIEPSRVAETFWRLYTERGEIRARVS